MLDCLVSPKGCCWCGDCTPGINRTRSVLRWSIFSFDALNGLKCLYCNRFHALNLLSIPFDIGIVVSNGHNLRPLALFRVSLLGLKITDYAAVAFGYSRTHTRPDTKRGGRESAVWMVTTLD